MSGYVPSRGQFERTPQSHYITWDERQTVLVEGVQHSADASAVCLGMDTPDCALTVRMTWEQLESIHHQLGIVLRQRDAQVRHVDPVEGCPWCPSVQLPEGEHWELWDDCEHFRQTGRITYVIRSDRTHVIHASGLSCGEATHLLETLTDPIPTVEIA